MGIRLILAICLTAGCTLLGRTASLAARRRLSLIEELISGVKTLRLHVVGVCENVSQALINTNCRCFVSVGNEMKQGCSAWDAWNKIAGTAYSRGGEMDSMVSRDREILDRLFEQLGESGRTAQEELLNSTVKFLSEQRETAKLILAERDKLYITVGFLFGLILAIAVI